MDEQELKQDIKLQEEEEKPTASKNAFKDLLRQQVKEVIKEMLLEDASFIDAPISSPKKAPEDKVADKLPIEKTFIEPSIIPYEPIADEGTEIPSDDAPSSPTSGTPPSPDDPPSHEGGGETPSQPTQPQQSRSEWDDYERQKGMSDYLDSEWSHKSYLLSTKFIDKEVLYLHELVLKELSLSNLPDTEIAFIYAVKMDCIEEWMSMGFYDLAKQRLTHMLFRLRLMTSVEGLELIAQHGTSAISMSMERLQPEREGMNEEDEQGKKKSLGIKNLVNKLRR